MIYLGVIELIVHSHHNIQRTILDRRRDDDLSHSAIEIPGKALRSPEASARFEHDIDPKIGPRDVTGSVMVAESDGAAVRPYRPVIACRLMLPTPLN